MIYITKEDLYMLAQPRMIEESMADDQTAINNIELAVIDEVKAALNGRYDIAKIFGNPPMRSSLLAKIISRMVMYDLFGRNAARKIGEDHQRNWEWALARLKDINAGREVLLGMPASQPNGGNAPLMYGNNRKSKFYI